MPGSLALSSYFGQEQNFVSTITPLVLQDIRQFFLWCLVELECGLLKKWSVFLGHPFSGPLVRGYQLLFGLFSYLFQLAVLSCIIDFSSAPFGYMKSKKKTWGTYQCNLDIVLQVLWSLPSLPSSFTFQSLSTFAYCIISRIF